MQDVRSLNRGAFRNLVVRQLYHYVFWRHLSVCVFPAQVADPGLIFVVMFFSDLHYALKLEPPLSGLTRAPPMAILGNIAVCTLKKVREPLVANLGKWLTASGTWFGEILVCFCLTGSAWLFLGVSPNHVPEAVRQGIDLASAMMMTAQHFIPFSYSRHPLIPLNRL